MRKDQAADKIFFCSSISLRSDAELSSNIHAIEECTRNFWGRCNLLKRFLQTCRLYLGFRDKSGGQNNTKVYFTFWTQEVGTRPWAYPACKDELRQALSADTRDEIPDTSKPWATGHPSASSSSLCPAQAPRNPAEASNVWNPGLPLAVPGSSIIHDSNVFPLPSTHACYASD